MICLQVHIDFAITEFNIFLITGRPGLGVKFRNQICQIEPWI